MFLSSLEQGLIFAILAMGVFITYKILDFPDLSVEGSFPFGAFILAKCLTMGLDPFTSTILSFLIGTLTGLITYVLHIKLKIAPILSGILTMTLLYSINLRINGKSNVALFSYKTIFGNIEPLIVLIIVCILTKIAMDLFLKTEIGYALIATGDNEKLIQGLGHNSDKYKMIGLMLSNGLVAMSGALMAQIQGFADIGMGTSIIVVALASIVVGDTFFKHSRKLKGTTRAIIGAVVYKLIGALAIDLGLSPNDLKAISAIIVIVFLSYNNFEIGKMITDKVKGGKVNA